MTQRPPSSPRGASTTDGSSANKRQANTDACELLMFLESHKIGHYTQVLLDHGYTLSNLDLLTPADMRQLRITNRAEVEQLVGLGRIVGEQKERLRKRFEAEAEAAAASIDPEDPPPPAASSSAATGGAGGIARHAQVAADHSVMTPTANECCRQATNFLDYRRVDRAWPMPASSLSRSLGLSTAKPPAPGTALLYELLMAPKTYPHPPLHGKANPPRRIADRTSSSDADGATGLGQSASPAASPRGEQRWVPVNQRNPVPPEMPTYTPRVIPGGVKRPKRVVRPRGHTHGASARSCPVCEDHVKAAEMHGLDCSDPHAAAKGDGQWQYQVTETLLLGDGKSEVSRPWRPFEPVESMKLEYAFKKKHPGVVVSGKYADFATMLWGGSGSTSRAGETARKRSMSAYFPIRRSTTAAVNFPGLKPREVVPTPGDDDAMQRALQLELATSFLRLCETEEQRARVGIMHTYTAETACLLAEIAAMMEELFAAQRARLEDQEAAARCLIEDELLGVALDKLWDEAERSVRKITYDVMTSDARRTSSNVIFLQYDIMREMEDDARRQIERQEEAERANLELLMAKFLEEIRRLQRKGDDDASARRRKFQMSNYADGCVVRCAICKSKDCEFFKQPWRSNWPHRGGVLDLDIDMRSHTYEMREMHHTAQVRLDKTCGGVDAKYREAHGHVPPVRTVAGLVAKANEKEYEEYQSVRKAERTRRKFRDIASPSSRSPSSRSGQHRTPQPSTADAETVDFNPGLSADDAAGGYQRAQFRHQAAPEVPALGSQAESVPMAPRRPQSAAGSLSSRPPFKVGRPHTPI